MLIKGELRYIQILKDRGTCIDSRLDEIEEALKHGEKFEEMWKRFKKEWGYYPTYSINKNLIEDIMNEFEQKYFPEPKKNLVRLMKELDKTVKEIMEEVD